MQYSNVHNFVVVMFDTNVFHQDVANQGTITIVNRENGTMSMGTEHVAVAEGDIANVIGTQLETNLHSIATLVVDERAITHADVFHVAIPHDVASCRTAFKLH